MRLSGEHVERCLSERISHLSKGIDREPILAIQTTTGDHVAARIQKLTDAGFATLWKSVGAVPEVWGWRKTGARGERKVWTLRRETL